jgi:Rieske Fe-S protein
MADLDRRELLCGGCAMALAGCGGPTQPGYVGTSADTGPGGDPLTGPLANPDYPCNQVIEPEAEGWVGFPISLHPDMGNVGGWAGLVIPDTDPAEWIVVAQVRAGCFVALSRRCTHQNGLLAYDADREQFVCPNHASLFDWAGLPVGGPAALALKVYTAGSDGEKVWVHIG